MDISSLLLPREQVAELGRKMEAGSSYCFEIRKLKQCLYYFGANHSRDPANPQYQELREYWNNFLSETSDRERIVLVEGQIQTPSQDLETAIKTGSEGRFIETLAHPANVLVACPEPDWNEINTAALKDFDLAHLAYYQFAAFVNSWKKFAVPRPDFDKSYKVFLENRSRQSFWNGFDFSLEHMKQIHQQVFDEEFDMNDDRWGRGYYLNPNTPERSIVNKLARFESDIRDVRIVEEIERYWKEGKSILVVYGSGHAHIQEPALKKLLS